MRSRDLLNSHPEAVPGRDLVLLSSTDKSEAGRYALLANCLAV